MQTIGSRLKAERDAAGLSQQQACDITGVTRKTLYNYESDERDPPGLFLAALAEHGIDVQYVVTGVRARAAGPAAEELKKAAEMAYGMVEGGGIKVTPAQFSQMFMTLVNAPQSQGNPDNS